ncbi:MAG: hypothetical protein AB2L11_04545 [Syntrophobacteraceae bacterium]
MHKWGARRAVQLGCPLYRKTRHGAIRNLKVGVLELIFCKEFPSETDFEALGKPACMIAEKHKEHAFR